MRGQHFRLGFLAQQFLMSYILGGLGARVDLLKQNFTLSMVGAATGVCFPIGLSYLLLYLGFGYGLFYYDRRLKRLS